MTDHVRRELFEAALQSALVDVRTPSLIHAPSPLTPMEMMVLRNIVDGQHTRGVTDENRAEHDTTLVLLVKRGFVSYHRKRVPRFDLTPTGCEALAVAEEKQGEVLGG